MYENYCLRLISLSICRSDISFWFAHCFEYERLKASNDLEKFISIYITSSQPIRSKENRWHISIRFPHMERNLQEICTITRLITWLPCMGIEHGTSIPRESSWSCRIQLNCTNWTWLIIMYSVADIKRKQIEPKQVLG